MGADGVPSACAVVCIAEIVRKRPIKRSRKASPGRYNQRQSSRSNTPMNRETETIPAFPRKRPTFSPRGLRLGLKIGCLDDFVAHYALSNVTVGWTWRAFKAATRRSMG